MEGFTRLLPCHDISHPCLLGSVWLPPSFLSRLLSVLRFLPHLFPSSFLSSLSPLSLCFSWSPVFLSFSLCLWTFYGLRLFFLFFIMFSFSLLRADDKETFHVYRGCFWPLSVLLKFALRLSWDSNAQRQSVVKKKCRLELPSSLCIQRLFNSAFRESFEGGDGRWIIWCELNFLFFSSQPLFLSPSSSRSSLCGVSFIETEMEVVCVASESRNWTHLPFSACGTKVGPSALCWLNSLALFALLAVFLKPVWFSPPPPPPQTWSSPPVKINFSVKLLL